MSEALQKLFEAAKGFAADQFRAKGEFIPMFVAETRDGTIAPIAAPFTSQTEKVMMAGMIRLLFKKLDVVRYVFIVEVWMAKISGDAVKDYDGPPPSEHPDRYEAIALLAEEAGNALGMCGQFKITRRGNKKPKLDKFEQFDKGMGSGRFADMLGGRILN